MNNTNLQMAGRAAPCKNSNAIPILENRVGCYESAKAKIKNPRCGQACHAKAQTDQGVSNSFRIVWPTTISQENTKPRRCTQKQESMLATDHCTRFRRRNQLRKTSLKLRTSSSTPPVSLGNLRNIHIKACLWFSCLAEVPSIPPCLYARAKAEYNVSTQVAVTLCLRRQGTSPAKKNLKPKMASILATLFCIIVITYKKDGEQKAKPKIASKKLPRISPAMENYFRAIPADGRSSRHSQPTCIAHNILAAAHGFKSSPSLHNRRNTKTSDSTRYTLYSQGFQVLVPCSD